MTSTSLHDSRPTARRGQPHGSRRAALTAAVLAALALAPLAPWRAGVALAQPAGRAAAAEKTGLDALDDSKLMGDLATRGLSKLLNYYFDTHNVPPEQREGITALNAVRQLESEMWNKLPQSEKLRIIKSIVAGIEKVLPTMTEPQVVMDSAAKLIVYGSARPVNTLEYWGDNPKTQAELRPIADTVVKMYAKAFKDAEARAAKLSNEIKNPNDLEKISRWEAMDGLSRFARYTMAFAMYDQALAMDRASAERKKVCDEATAILADYDIPESGVQASVKLRIAKLQLVKGDYKKAREAFDWVIKSPVPPPAPPPASIKGNAAKLSEYNRQAAEQAALEHTLQVYQGNYFRIVADVEDKQIEQANGELAALVAWQKQNMPQDKATQAGIEAAAAMLHYRLHVAAAEVAKDAKARNEANGEAIKELMALLEKRRELAPIIFEQVLGRLPEEPDMKELNPLVLQALVIKGAEEIGKGDDEPLDRKALEKGWHAAEELLGRKDTPIKPEDLEVMALREAVMIHRLAADPALKEKKDEKDVAERADLFQKSAKAYLSYLTTYKDNRERMDLAMQGAQATVMTLRTDPALAKTPGNQDLYEKFVGLAYHDKNLPGHLRFAYGYGLSLLDHLNTEPDLDKFNEAIEALHNVPEDPLNPRLAINARSKEMAACQGLMELLERKNPPGAAAKKEELSRHIQTLAAELNPQVERALATTTDPALKETYQEMRVDATIAAFRLAKAQKDYKKVEQLLGDVEKQLAGLNNPQYVSEQLAYVLSQRIEVQMASGQMEAAVGTLRRYLENTTDQAKKLYTLRVVLKQIEQEWRHANEDKNAERIVELGRDRADLAKRLLAMPLDPKTRREARTYYADVVRTQAANETEPARRKEMLAEATSTYQEMLKDVQALVKAGEAVRAPTDAQKKALEDDQKQALRLELNIALVSFDLGNYAEARKALGHLFSMNAIGKPTIVEYNEKEKKPEERPNELYWEALYKLMKSTATVGDQASKDEVAGQLKFHYIEYGSRLRDPKFRWFSEFAELRQQLLPKWDGDTKGAAAKDGEKKEGKSPATAPVAGG